MIFGMKISRDFIRKSLMLILGTFLSVNAYAGLVFVTEENAINTDNFIINADDSASDFVDLEFGALLGVKIRYDILSNKFIINENLDLGNNQLLNTRVENLALAPICDGTVNGKIYHNTTDNNSYVCNGTEWRQIDASSGGSFAQTVTVAKSGGDYTSIKSAIDSITDSSTTKRYQVLVYPGIYNEDPMTMPDYVSVIGTNFENVAIVATNTTLPLITAGHDSLIENVKLIGATASSCLYVDDSVYGFQLEFENCDRGVHIATTNGNFTGEEFFTHSGTFTDFIKIDTGAESHIGSLHVLENPTMTNIIHSDGASTHIEVSGLETTSANITNGVYVNNDGNISLKSFSIENATYGLRIGATGSGQIDVFGGGLSNSEIHDVYVESASGIFHASGVEFNKNKLNINPAAQVIASFIDDTVGDESLSVLGELNVGSVERPSESIFGEGDSYTDGMLIYTENASNVFADVSGAAASASGSSTFSFPGTAVDNAIYIGSDRKNKDGNFVQFFGHKLKMGGTALVSGTGSLTYEYWNGSAWTNFNVMCTHASLFYRYDGACFQRSSTSEHVRFQESIENDWVKNDPMSLGVNRYWVRLRVISAITTAPVLEQFKVHSNRTEINENGKITFHGKARERRSFVVSPATVFYGKGNPAAANRAFPVADLIDGWDDQRLLSSFSGDDEATGSISLPKGIDTSSGIKARIYWKRENTDAGDIKWDLDYIVSSVIGVKAASGDSVVPVARTSGSDIENQDFQTIQTTATGNGTAYEAITLSEFTTDIDISGYYEGDQIFLRLRRSDDIEDTYNKDAVMVGFELSALFWTNGD